MESEAALDVCGRTYLAFAVRSEADDVDSNKRFAAFDITHYALEDALRREEERSQEQNRQD
jgi:hypothetical protein